MGRISAGAYTELGLARGIELNFTETIRTVQKQFWKLEFASKLSLFIKKECPKSILV